ncbi:MAG TPA: TolC family protein [Longimicrobiales bacterium]|nr:TolC family protein [Longimicrobiales bacterium]
MKIMRRRLHRSWRLLFLPALLAGPNALAAQDAVRVVSLEEAVRLAAARDPAVVAAEAAVDGARAGRLQARGAWLPSVSVNSVYGNSSNQRFDQSTGQLVSENYNAGIDGGLVLFAGGRRLTALRAAEAELDAADANEVARRFEAGQAAKVAYHAATAASDLLRVSEQRLERAGQQLGFARTRYEVGTATTSDLLRAEIELANAELGEYEARSQLRSAGLVLGRAIGVPEEVQAAEADLPETAPALQPVAVLVARAVRGSPAVLAAEAAAASSRAQRLAAYTPYLPTVQVNGGYDWFAFEFPPDQRSWSFRVVASLPVFNNFQREAALIRAGAQERTAEARALDASLAARVAVEEGVRAIELAERRVEVSARTVALAAEDLRVQEERYQIGATTILELQASQVALAESEVAGVRARQDLATAVARLETILGETIGDE